jgi:hypothetical protein
MIARRTCVVNIQALGERVSQPGFEDRLHEFQPFGRKYDYFQQQPTMHPSVYVCRAFVPDRRFRGAGHRSCEPKLLQFSHPKL